MLVAGDFFDGNSQESVTLVFKGGEEREVSCASPHPFVA